MNVYRPVLILEDPTTLWPSNFLQRAQTTVGVELGFWHKCGLYTIHKVRRRDYPAVDLRATFFGGLRSLPPVLVRARPLALSVS